MVEWFKYFVIFVVGAIGDIIVNKMVSSMSNPNGGLAGLKFFYSTLPWYMAALWAGLLFVLIYWISDSVYELIRPNLPRQWVNSVQE